MTDQANTSSSSSSFSSSVAKPKWYTGLPDAVRKRIGKSRPADEEINKPSLLSLFDTDGVSVNAEIAKLETLIMDDDKIPGALQGPLCAIIATIKNIEQDQRLKTIEMAKTISCNEVRVSAAMDAAATNAGDISELCAGLADTSRQYSKRCLEFTGNGLPDRCLEGANDGVKFLVERIVGRILCMDLTELDIAEIGVCHYMNSG
jgi:hypothetical protein